jgi:hypothetical protein
MNNLKQLKDIGVADKYIFCGHLMACIGSMLISIGAILKMASSGDLPAGHHTFDMKSGASSAVKKDGGYFDV